MSSRATTPRLAERVAGRALLATIVVCVVALLGFARPAAAHTSFVASDPADGSIIDGPVSDIVIQFTGVSEEAGEGFVALDSAGQLRRPSSVTTADSKTFTLSFDPALSGGLIGVRWSVRAGDSHPIEGSFSFTAGGAPPTTPTTSPPASDPPAVTSAPANTPTPDNTSIPETDTTSAPTTTQTTETSAVLTDTSDQDGAAPGPTSEPIDMASFLQVDETRPGETTAGVGRVVTLLSTVFVLGGAAFAFAALRAPAAEIRWLLRWVKIAGIALAVGAAIEYLGVARIADDSLWSAWTSSAGAAPMMRLVAGIAVAVGLAATTVAVRRPMPRPLSAAVDIDPGAARRQSATAPGPGEVDEIARWVPDRRSALGVLGGALVVVSFWFDGHTVTEGFRLLHAAANSVHVVAGSIWAGGVIAMAAILWRRHRQHRPGGALDLVLRFSSIAAAALGAVVVAGVVMAVLIADSFSDITGTEWGQTLLLKTAGALVAMAFGAWNHFRLLPSLEARPDDAALRRTARSTVTAEAIVLVFVVIVTASLVAAAV